MSNVVAVETKKSIMDCIIDINNYVIDLENHMPLISLGLVDEINKFADKNNISQEIVTMYLKEARLLPVDKNSSKKGKLSNNLYELEENHDTKKYILILPSAYAHIND